MEDRCQESGKLASLGSTVSGVLSELALSAAPQSSRMMPKGLHYDPCCFHSITRKKTLKCTKPKKFFKLHE
jgi:hypothetical protein